MITFFIVCVFLGFLLVPFIFIAKGASDLKNSEKIECPKCGKEFRLVKESSECTKCRTRITKTKDGEITM